VLLYLDGSILYLWLYIDAKIDAVERMRKRYGSDSPERVLLRRELNEVV
jgi:hypothetical protein